MLRYIFTILWTFGIIIMLPVTESAFLPEVRGMQTLPFLFKAVTSFCHEAVADLLKLWDLPQTGQICLVL